MTEVLAALLGTIVGAFISWIASNYQNKLQTTFSLHREFDGDTMYRSRLIADQLIKKYPTSTLYEIYEKCPDDAFYIWQVVHFYQRLSLAIKYNQVKKELMSELFGEIFIWWYIGCFDKQLIPVYKHSSSRKQILDLKKWFDTHSAKSDLSTWNQRALEDLEQRISRK